VKEVEDISNKTLALLVSLAIIVAIGGLFAATKKPTITGLVTDTESAQGRIDLEANAVLTVTGGIDFGKGRVNGTTTVQNATLMANGTGTANYFIWDGSAWKLNSSAPGYWLNEVGTVGFGATTFPSIIIKNEGGYPLKITVDASKNASKSDSATFWYCDTAEAGLDQSRMRVSTTDVQVPNNCDSTGTLTELVAGTPVEVCAVLNNTDTTGEYFVLEVAIDSDCAPTADYVNNTFTFVGDTAI
jgi:hypothetical protein